MRKGYAKPLTFDDLWVLRSQDQSSNVSMTFAETWEKELKKPKYDRHIMNVASTHPSTVDHVRFLTPLRFPINYRPLDQV